jgi:hypothetical protein
MYTKMRFSRLRLKPCDLRYPLTPNDPLPRSPPMPGRPRALCETKQREICMLVATGCTLETAARFVGCTPVTIFRESRRNPEFGERLGRSRASAEITPIKTMRQAATSQWRAAAWLLERTQPEQFAKRAANTFTQEDVATLLSHACEVFRRETRDAEKYARIKRHVAALVKKSFASPLLDDADPAFAPPVVAPAETATPSSPSRVENEAASTHANDQNGTNTLSK